MGDLRWRWAGGIFPVGEVFVLVFAVAREGGGKGCMILMVGVSPVVVCLHMYCKLQ